MVERTQTLYKMSRVDLLRYFTLLKTASFLEAFRQVSWICLAQESVELRYIPKCLCSLTRSTNESLKISGGELNKTLFSEKITSLLLPGLNETFHFVAQLLITSRSLFKSIAVSAGSIADANMQVSSAKSKISDFWLKARSAWLSEWVS